MDIQLANPRGFCAGVDRAIEIVERALEIFGAPIYVRHEVVHNRFVVDSLRQSGAVFVDELDQIPDGNTVIFSAHGISKQVRSEAESRDLRIFDATCPLVTKVHLEVARHCRSGHDVILIGHRGHPEVEGTMGQYTGNEKGGRIHLVVDEKDVDEIQIDVSRKLAYVSQTTLSVDDTQKIVEALKRRFPNIEGPKKNDICYATQNRQDAVKTLASNCDLVLVVGSTNSSNSNRLKEISTKLGTPAYLIDGAGDIHREWIGKVEQVGVTAGASAPEVLVEEVIATLQDWGVGSVTSLSGREENVIFSLPRELRPE